MSADIHELYNQENSQSADEDKSRSPKTESSDASPSRSAPVPPAVNSKPLWSIPITYTTSRERNFEDTEPKFWMNEEIVAIPKLDEEPEEKDWVLFNVKRSGYYLVNYDLDNWAAILRQLTTDPDVIDPLSRAQVNEIRINVLYVTSITTIYLSFP
jgi:hypothetical protein